ncbi:MAG: amidohydrolase, partial [Planctomycetia bacterium]|nr:amidohydrolase [Planctomycetia bacterium]
FASTAAPLVLSAADDGAGIIDTHQHLWDLKKFKLPWLTKGSLLNRDYLPTDYAVAIKGLGIVKSVYLEVDVTPEQHDAEADSIAELCASGKTPTSAAVIGGRPASETFAKYAKRFRDHKSIRGVRRVLHVAETPSGHCLDKAFVAGVRLLGELGLHFEFCVRHGDLPDCIKLADECPGTRFVLDHLGNPDLKKHDQWKKDLAELAKRKNVMACKVSGIVVSAEPLKWTAADLAPVVNHTLDTFGPDRVMFGSDWPVCLLTATIAKWLGALQEIVKERKAADNRKLFHDNAARIYRV